MSGLPPGPIPSKVWGIIADELTTTTAADLYSGSRTAEVVAARRRIVRRLRDELELSWPRIGHWLGIDHSSAIYLYRTENTQAGRARGGRR